MKTPAQHAVSFLLPITVIVVVPYVVQDLFNMTGGLISFLGILLMIAGFTFLFATVGLLSHMGKGTLAPWSPTEHLVVEGIYSHTRNPMITGVIAVLLGQSLVFESKPIFIWALVFFCLNTIYFILSEEPGLKKRFGDEYDEYRRNVPRWIPRLTSWKPKGRASG